VERFSYFIFLLAAALLSSGCAEKRTAADSGDDMYVVSDGMLAVEATEAAASGIRILDRNGDAMDGVIVLRSGLTIANADGESSVIGPTPVALSVLDENKDNRLDEGDPAWGNMHLAVDYNGDNIIGEGEYALIGECGIDALELDLNGNLARSLHSNGKIKLVKLPNSG
jgi:hypothetical protein